MVAVSAAISKTMRFFENVQLKQIYAKSRKSISKRTYATSRDQKPFMSSQYCLDVVRRYDYENFLACLLLPQHARSAALAVRAYNVELAQVQDTTTQPLMAKMRLQFWRETLDQVYQGSSPKQPVAVELQRAVAKHELSKRWLLSLIESREDHLESKQFTTMQDVEDYSEKSNSVLYYLILQILGIKNIHADHVGSHLGKAEGIVRLIRGVPHLGTKRIVLLPQDIMMQHKVSQEDVIRGSRDERMKSAVFDIACVAKTHIEHVKALMKDVPPAARIGLLPEVTISSYLGFLQKADFDIFDSSLQKRNRLLPLHLWWAKVRKT